MSSATATAGPVPQRKGSKKLVIIALALALVLIAGGAGAFLLMKRGVAAGGAGAEAAGSSAAADPSQPPTYLALDPFVVNLADREVERYAQIAVTLQVDDPKFAERMKAYMPSIRNSILLVLSDKNSQQLLARSGKDALAAEIMREAVRPLGLQIEADDEEPPADGKKRRKRRAQVHNPVTHVHFANFIIQ